MGFRRGKEEEVGVKWCVVVRLEHKFRAPSTKRNTRMYSGGSRSARGLRSSTTAVAASTNPWTMPSKRLCRLLVRVNWVAEEQWEKR